MDKINKHAIERITVNDKEHLDSYIHYKANPDTFWRKGNPEQWGVPFIENMTRSEISKEGLLMIIDNKVYLKPNVTFSMVSGDRIIHRFDTYKQSEKFAYDYIKRNDIEDLINVY